MQKVQFLEISQQQRKDIILIVVIANLHKKTNYWVNRTKPK